MTNTQKFKELFPLKGQITQDIINKANIYSTLDCIGALTLKAALGENIKLVDRISWGFVEGNPVIDQRCITLTSIKRNNFMTIRKPQEVTFILK